MKQFVIIHSNLCVAMNRHNARVKADEDAEATTVAISEKNFPDKAFREKLSGGLYDRDGDKKLSARTSSSEDS